MLVPVILCISPYHDGGPSGFVYLDVYKLEGQAAIMAYFANACRVTAVLPCQNFNEFLVSNSLRTRQVSFLLDLPTSNIAMGWRILAENAAFEEAGPDLSWLPHSPSMSLATLLSHPARSVSRSTNIMMRVGTTMPLTVPVPIPMGLKHPLHLSLFLRAVRLVQVFSPITTSLTTGDLFSTWTRSPQRSYILTQHSLATLQPFSSTSVVLSITSSTVLPSSSDSSNMVTHPPPPAPAPSSTSIKDNSSDLGIKPITDKESWINVKKIIDARLHRGPYWLGNLKELVTMDANAATSVWWEEVIAFYCKPPVSDLFIEER